MHLGYSKDKIINTFYSTNKYSYNKETKSWITDFNLENYKRPIKLSYDLIDAKNNKKVLGKGEKLNIVIAKKLKEKGLNKLFQFQMIKLSANILEKILKIKMEKY